MAMTRLRLAASGGVIALLAVMGLTAPAAAAPATVTGKICATADTNLCIGAPGFLQRGGTVYSTDSAHARTFGFPGTDNTGVIWFTAASGLNLRAPCGGGSDNVIIGFATDPGTQFQWIDASNGGHYFWNPHCGLYLGVTGPDGSTVAVVPKGLFGWDLRFNGP